MLLHVIIQGFSRHQLAIKAMSTEEREVRQFGFERIERKQFGHFVYKEEKKAEEKRIEKKKERKERTGSRELEGRVFKRFCHGL